MERIFNQSELESLCKKWQEKLGLQEWDVKVLIKRQPIMGEEVKGSCWYNLHSKRAVIKILDPIDYQIIPYNQRLWKQDMEFILVHELLHIHFAPFGLIKPLEEYKVSLDCIAQEQAINAISKTLVDLDRKCEACELVAKG